MDAFIEEVPHFPKTPYRYTWLRYLPSKNSGVDFFWEFRYALDQRLLESTIVESEDGSLRIPTSVRYIPLDLRDEDNTHLILSDATIPKYVSHQYSKDELGPLRQVGVVEITKAEWLRDLEHSLPGCYSKSNKWHSRLARALMPLIPSYKIRISYLSLIPLSDGRWVSSSSGKLFFPQENGTHSVPEGIEVFELDETAQADHDRRMLYINLGVEQFSVSAIQKLILSKHSRSKPDPEPSLVQLLSQTAFLYNTGWKNDDKAIPFWVFTETHGRRRSFEVYVQSASRYLGKHTHKFPFLHCCQLQTGSRTMRLI